MTLVTNRYNYIDSKLRLWKEKKRKGYKLVHLTSWQMTTSRKGGPVGQWLRAADEEFLGRYGASLAIRWPQLLTC